MSTRTNVKRMKYRVVHYKSLPVPCISLISPMKMFCLGQQIILPKREMFSIRRARGVCLFHLFHCQKSPWFEIWCFTMNRGKVSRVLRGTNDFNRSSSPRSGDPATGIVPSASYIERSTTVATSYGSYRFRISEHTMTEMTRRGTSFDTLYTAPSSFVL